MAGIVRIHAPWRDERDLRALLAALATLDRYYLETGQASRLPLDGRIVYEREPYGQEEWLTLPLLEAEGAGDCEDLAAAFAASYGGIPVTVDNGTGGGRHAIVVNPETGQIADPSAHLGMGRR